MTWSINYNPAIGSALPPSAPAGLTLFNQGGFNNWLGGSPNTSYQAITWSAATAGSNPVDHYKVYRNGVAIATVTAPYQFYGYISGHTLTVTSVVNGNVLAGLRYSAAGLAFGTMITPMSAGNYSNSVSSQLTGTAQGVGTYSVNVSQTLGSSGSPVLFTAWVYEDTTATNSFDPTFANPATTYDYDVSAVDTHGTEGSLTTQFVAYGYQSGYSNWSDSDLAFSSPTFSYADTTGNPQGGPFDIYLDTGASNGGLNPTSDTPQCIQYCLEIGAFNYMVMDYNPGPGDSVLNQFGTGIVTRIPPGDAYGWISVNLTSYGPAPAANTWGTYKVPLSAMGIGECAFTGSISGTTLTVTSVDSGPSIIQASGLVSGTGVPAGTYITASGQNGAVGTHTVAGAGISTSTSVSSRSMNYRRTGRYKTTLGFNNANDTGFFNNLGFTRS